jgi:hypothetical protein
MEQDYQNTQLRSQNHQEGLLGGFARDVRRFGRFRGKLGLIVWLRVYIYQS